MKWVKQNIAAFGTRKWVAGRGSVGMSNCIVPNTLSQVATPTT